MRRGTKAGFKFISYRKGVTEKIEGELAKRLLIACKIWQGGVVKEMTGPKTGKWYTVPFTKVKYRASSGGPPPESPAVRTGILRASYGTDVDKEKLVGYMGTDLDYGLYLERGTEDMLPRPAIEPAFRNNEAQIRRVLAEEEIK